MDSLSSESRHGHSSDEHHEAQDGTAATEVSCVFSCSPYLRASRVEIS